VYWGRIIFLVVPKLIRRNPQPALDRRHRTQNISQDDLNRFTADFAVNYPRRLQGEILHAIVPSTTLSEIHASNMNSEKLFHASWWTCIPERDTCSFRIRNFEYYDANRLLFPRIDAIFARSEEEEYVPLIVDLRKTLESIHIERPTPPLGPPRQAVPTLSIGNMRISRVECHTGVPAVAGQRKGSHNRNRYRRRSTLHRVRRAGKTTEHRNRAGRRSSDSRGSRQSQSGRSGVHPDIEVWRSIEDLFRKRDLILETAAVVLAESAHP